MSFEMNSDREGMAVDNKYSESNEELSQETIQQTEEVVPETKQESKENDNSTTKTKENNEQENWRAIRKKAEQLQKERDEALRLVEEAQKRLISSNQPQPTTQEDIDEPLHLKEDDFVEGKHLSKFEKKIKRLEQQLHTYNTRSTEMAVEAQLKSQYPDFTQVVSEENLKTLRMAYPELAATINNSSSDLYSKALSAYTLIKRFGLYQEDTYSTERDNANINAKKPKPLASINPQTSDSPLSHANAFAQGLTEDLRKQLYREMIESRKGY